MQFLGHSVSVCEGNSVMECYNPLDTTIFSYSQNVFYSKGKAFELE